MNANEVIGAFVDRERVDPELLKQALSTDEGRDYLVDLVALREVTSEAPVPEAPVLRDRRASGWLAMAAAVLLSLSAGYFVGQRQPVSVVVDTPMPVEQRISIPIIPPAPAPTTVIKLEPGVDWKETVGG
jgi:hypothetical protein